MSGINGNGEEDRVRFTGLAKIDLDSIVTASLEKFGEAQARKLTDGLRRTLALLVAFPQLGTDQSHLRADMRRHVHGVHAVYYRIDGKGIRVLRILGPGQDPLHEFLG